MQLTKLAQQARGGRRGSNGVCPLFPLEQVGHTPYCWPRLYFWPPFRCMLQLYISHANGRRDHTLMIKNIVLAFKNGEEGTIGKLFLAYQFSRRKLAMKGFVRVCVCVKEFKGVSGASCLCWKRCFWHQQLLVMPNRSFKMI